MFIRRNLRICRSYCHGLPVAELIDRVAKRYAQPTSEQLKGRLLFAATIQRAFLKIEEKRDLNYAVRMFGRYKELYDYLMKLHLEGGDLQSALKFLHTTLKPSSGCVTIVNSSSTNNVGLNSRACLPETVREIRIPLSCGGRLVR